MPPNHAPALLLDAAERLERHDHGADTRQKCAPCVPAVGAELLRTPDRRRNNLRIFHFTAWIQDYETLRLK
jgi:hypothetical protein